MEVRDLRRSRFWILLTAFAAVITVFLLLGPYHHPIVEVTDSVVVKDSPNDVIIYNYGGFPNVSLGSIDIIKAEISLLSNSTLILKIDLGSSPLDIRSSGYGANAKYMFSYSLTMPVKADGHEAMLRLSYDNLVSSPARAVSIRINDGMSYAGHGNYCINNKTLVIRAQLPAIIKSFFKGEVTVKTILQSALSEYSGAIDEASYNLK